MVSLNSKQEHRNGYHRADLLDVFSPPSAGPKITIRRYHPDDRERIRQICCDTGWLGRPIEPIFSDRELFADLIAGPYLEHEPDWALVAEANGRVAGYLLGSVRPDFDRQLMRSGSRTAFKMLYRLLRGRYEASGRRFVRWVLFSGIRERPKHPRGAAHLHFDLEEEFRGNGIGRRLWNTYENMLRSAGVKRCYGEFFSHPRRKPELVYARYGFSVFDRHETSLFRPEIPDRVEIVCSDKWL